MIDIQAPSNQNIPLGEVISQQLKTLQPGLFKTSWVTFRNVFKETPLWTTAYCATWVCESLVQVAPPFLISSLAALSNKTNSPQAILTVMVAFVGTWLMQGALNDLRPWINERFIKKMNACMEKQFQTDLATRSNKTLNTPEFSDLAVSLKDNFSKVSAFVERNISIGSSVLTCSLAAAALATVSPAVTLGLVGIGALQLYNGLRSAKRFEQMEQTVSQKRRILGLDRLYAMSASYISEFRSLLKTKSSITRVEETRREIDDTQADDVRKRALGAFSISTLSTLAVKGYLIYSVMQPALSGASVDLSTAAKVVLMAVTFEFGLSNLLRRFSDQLKDFTFAKKALVIGELGQPDRDPKREYSQLPLDQTPTIKFDNLHFLTPDHKPILREINLELEPGKIYGICGSSGAGKTSLINLLRLEEEPSVGQIYISGVKLSNLEPDCARRLIGGLSQHYLNLLSYTVRDAIELGLQDGAAQDTFKQACKIANIDFLGPDYEDADLFLGRDFPKSRNFSGGQLQKIALARAIAHNPQVLILDEPTSALGADDENIIFPAVIEWAKSQNKTLLIISHKFANLTTCDKIIYLAAGQICEQGSHAELINLGGDYASRYRLEASKYDQTESA